MDLGGKVVIVTGASSGIGEATALELGRQGAYVAVVARRKDRLDKLVNRIEKTGKGKALAIGADVTDRAACKEVVDQVLKQWGKVDVLINNAGVMLLGSTVGAPLEEWERMIQVNLLGLLYMTYATLPSMRAQKSGHVVNVSSVAGRTVNAGSGVYNATKWGVNAFTEALRQELVDEQSHIRTTLIEPGAVVTELASHNRPEVQEVLQERWKGITKRLSSDDIADAILYALTRPIQVSVNEILLRPSDQRL